MNSMPVSPTRPPDRAGGRAFLLLTLLHHSLKLCRHCYVTATAGIQRGCRRGRGTQLFEGDSIFLKRYCREGARSVPFVWLAAHGEVEDTVQTTIMPLGRKEQLFGEVGIFPSQHCRRREGLVTVFCFVCQEGTSSLVPSFLESASREIRRPGDFLYSGDL